MLVNSNDNALLSSSITAIGISLITGLAKTPIKLQAVMQCGVLQKQVQILT